MATPKLFFPQTLLSEGYPSIIRFSIYDTNNSDVEASILLPVPIALSHGYAVQFDDLEAGFLGKSIQEQVQVFTGGQDQSEATANIGAGALAALGGQVSVFRRLTGFGLNKGGQLTINRPSNRNFNFRFNLVPNNEGEAKTLQSIIDIFKYAMHPPVPSSGDEFVYLNPARFVIDFLYNPDQKENPNLFRSYFCFLTGLEIDQHAAGAPAYYEKGYPQNRAFSLSFQELSPLTRQDIQNLEPPNREAGGGGASNIIQGTRGQFSILSDPEAAVSTVSNNIENITNPRNENN